MSATTGKLSFWFGKDTGCNINQQAVNEINHRWKIECMCHHKLIVINTLPSTLTLRWISSLNIYIYGIRSLMAIVCQFGGGLLRIYLSKSVIIWIIRRKYIYVCAHLHLNSNNAHSPQIFSCLPIYGGSHMMEEGIRSYDVWPSGYLSPWNRLMNKKNRYIIGMILKWSQLVERFKSIIPVLAIFFKTSITWKKPSDASLVSIHGYGKVLFTFMCKQTTMWWRRKSLQW